ncbi:TIGR03560 family F420-dependent LLM class oxidoreductase [Candidatus Bathyarchaeota archaeon]|nr:MAG: TIGR03560 family F420-dependent LLM class oxidoreductase [Candidatus Bathyarchaeota archaeon]TMI56790.1 MAG: TIGR03560 family F420-dependent LLM class oxidoreductase [Candidatus Bathyarchaeota archaeon]
MDYANKYRHQVSCAGDAPVKFGVQIENHLGMTYNGVRKVALEAEKSGFDGLFVCDHLMGRNEETFRQPCLDPWVTLGGLAQATKKTTLGTLVSAVGFRHPSLLAKMGATLDHVSGGRLQLTVGAGWHEPEYKAYGIPFPPVGERMQQLREAVQIIRSMWTQDQATFEGKYFKIDGAWCYPRPVSPKIWVGGVGEKTLLRIVADLADGWNAVGLSADEYARKLEILRLFCENAGRKLNTIKRSYYGTCLVGSNENEFRESFNRYYGQYRKPEESTKTFVERMRSTRPFIGTAGEVADKMKGFEELGVSYFILYFPDKDGLGLLKRFSDLVMPGFASAS